MFRIPIRLAAVAMAADVAAISFTRGDIQWLLGVLGFLAAALWSFGRKVGAAERSATDLQARFTELEKKVERALEHLTTIGTGRRHVEREGHGDE